MLRVLTSIFCSLDTLLTAEIAVAEMVLTGITVVETAVK